MRIHTIASLLLAPAIAFLATATESDGSEASAIEPQSFDEIPAAGFARWDTGSLNVIPMNSVPSLRVVVPGNADRASLVRIEVWAQFGPIRHTVLDETVSAAPGTNHTLELELGNALALHELQRAFLTQLNGRATTLLADGRPGVSHRFGTIYVAFDEAYQKHTLIDRTRKQQLYADGITSRQVREGIAMMNNRSGPEEGISLGVGPGIAIEQPIDQTTRPSDE